MVSVATFVTFVALFNTCATPIFSTNANAAEALSTSGPRTALLGIVCQGNIAKDNQGCSRCPTFTGSGENGGDTYGEVVEVGPVLQGSFVSPNAIEAYVGLRGCEPHVANYQGAVLLRKSNSKWGIVRYDTGIGLGDCQRFRYQTGADLLACSDAYVNQGYVITSVGAIYIGFENTSWKRIQSAQDNAAACRPTIDAAGIQASRKRSTSSLEITVTEFHAPSGTKENDCPTDEAWKAIQKSAKTVTHRLTFAFDGQRFSPTKRSAATSRCLNNAVEATSTPGQYCPPVS